MLSHCFKVRTFIPAAVLITGLGFVSPATAYQERLFFVDLNTGTAKVLGSDYAEANGINDAGQVAGTFFPSNSSPHAFITGPNGDGIKAIGPLDLPFIIGSDINNAGQVVGSYTDYLGSDQGFITGPDGVGMRDLGGIDRDGIRTYAVGINNEGQVVGASRPDIPGPVLHAFITGPNGEGLRDIGTLGDPTNKYYNYSSAADINDTGQVVGRTTIGANEDPNEFSHAFITGPDGTGMRDLGTLGGDLSFAGGINNEGHVVGSSHLSTGEEHAFITGPDGTGMIDLGTLGGSYSEAHDINNAGQVVGMSRIATGEEHAFITGPNGEGMIDLNSLVKLSEGVFLTEAMAINNNGQVITMGVVPEPGTYALMLAGLGLIGFMAWRKRMENS